jgi:iron complex outermembrane receptor protein
LEILKEEISGQYIGKRYSKEDNSDTDEGVYWPYDPRFVMDTDWRVKVAREFLLFFGIENIFDRQYYEYSKALGRTYTFGLEARF